MSSIVNKVKEALHSDKKDTTHTEGTHTTHSTALGGNNRGVDGPATRTDGPHTSNVANKADPRVDSDRDHSHNLGANPQGSATTGHTTAGHTTTTGHSTATHGTTGLTGTTGHHNTSTHGTSGLTGTTGTTGVNTSTNAGPHSQQPRQQG